VDRLRTSTEPAYMIAIYILGIAGLFLVPRILAVIAVTFLAYQTIVAMIFVGVTRYRVPWDFLTCLLASAALVALARRAELRFVGRPRLEQ
jgi:hypothetical protein